MVHSIARAAWARVIRPPRNRDERGEAVQWMIVVGFGIAIAYFAGDALWDVARNIASSLSRGIGG